MKKRLFALLLASVMVAGIAAGCGAGAQKDFDLVVNFASEPTTIDPALNSAVDGAVMIQHSFEGLYKWVDDGEGNAKLALGQAKDVKVSDDGLVWTFTLRDDIFWSDHTEENPKPVTANDFVYAWQRAVDPATAADYNYMLGMVLNANDIMTVDEATGKALKDKSELGIKALDEKTLEITLGEKCEYFQEICAFAVALPVRQDMIEQAGDQWTQDPATYIGNGPYKMKEWVHNSYILYVPSETYYDYKNLGPSSIKFALMDDTNAIYAGFQSKELNFIEEVPANEIATLLESGELHVVPYIGTYYVCFQTQKAPFDDARVREAFTLAIDRDYIVKQITQTGQVPANGFVPAGINDAKGPSGDDFNAVGGGYYDASKEAYEANCEKAKQLLAEAGYPNGEGFPVVEYLYNTSENHRLIGEALQNMWQNVLGVTVTLNNQDWGVFLETRKNGEYSIARAGWIADYNDPMTFLDQFVTGGGNNDPQYANPAFDAKVAEAKSTADTEARFKIMHEIEDIMMNDYIVGPIYFYTQKYMAQGFENMFYTPLGYFFFMYATPSK